jgi:hypothetical protein
VVRVDATTSEVERKQIVVFNLEITSCGTRCYGNVVNLETITWGAECNRNVVVKA